MFALNSSQCCFEKADVQKAFHQLSEELFSSRGEKIQTMFTKGKQNKPAKKKKKSLFLKAELTRGQGGLRLVAPAPSLEKGVWPRINCLTFQAEAGKAGKTSPRPRRMLQSCDVCLPQPINTSKDALNQSPYLEPCFLFSFHVVSLRERIKAMRLLFPHSIRRNSLK